MSHELRTPLTNILGYSELLREQPDLRQNNSLFPTGMSRVGSANSNTET